LFGRPAVPISNQRIGIPSTGPGTVEASPERPDDLCVNRAAALDSGPLFRNP